jgi:hypothetical protein
LDDFNIVENDEHLFDRILMIGRQAIPKGLNHDELKRKQKTDDSLKDVAGAILDGHGLLRRVHHPAGKIGLDRIILVL